MEPVLTPGDTTTAVVKSKWTSKTNITAILLAVFGVLTATGVLPAALATPEAIGSIVAAGGVLVAAFRTLSKSILA